MPCLFRDRGLWGGGGGPGSDKFETRYIPVRLRPTYLSGHLPPAVRFTYSSALFSKSTYQISLLDFTNLRVILHTVIYKVWVRNNLSARGSRLTSPVYVSGCDNLSERNYGKTWCDVAAFTYSTSQATASQLTIQL